MSRVPEVTVLFWIIKVLTTGMGEVLSDFLAKQMDPVVAVVLGFAAGNLTATTMGWGYFASGVVFAVVIAVPAVAHRAFGLNVILAFWFAYIVTRPLGASFADWLGQPASRGGVGLGLGPVSLGLTVVILVLVGYLAVTRTDVVPEPFDPERTDVLRF